MTLSFLGVTMFLKGLIFILILMISVAMSTLMERKVLALSGLRVGPNKISIYGLLQPVTDAFKLLSKQTNYLSDFSMNFYYLSSFIMFCSSFLIWSSISMGPAVLFKFPLMMVLILMGMNSFNIMISGWSSSNKFSMMGSMRSVAQLISYEPPLYMALMVIMIIYKSMNFQELHLYPKSNLFLLIPLVFYVWLISIMAEMSRVPFDFSESESELVSGFNTEFGSKCFTLIFLAEYSNIIMFMCLTTIMFFSESITALNFTITLLMIKMMFFTRATLPRTRYDKLMMICWKIMIPTSTLILTFYVLTIW